MLNPNAPIPLYRQLADLLAAQIRTGDPAPGRRIPSEHQLAATHGIGRPTVPRRVAPRVFTAITGEVSVRP